MSLISGISSFFGLDIGTSAIRVVQLKGSGPVKTIDTYGYIPIDGKLAFSDSKADQQQLAEAVRQVVKKSGISTRNVAVGIPSSKVFTTVVDMERLSPAELAKTIRYQAESFIPTPIAESKIDWAMIGESQAGDGKIKVLLSSVANNYAEARLDLLESIGLNVIAFEPDTMALARAVIPYDVVAPQMILDIGNQSTDLVVCIDGAPHLTRSIPLGSESIVRAATQGLNIEEKQAMQFVYKFGLSKDKLEGQIYGAIVPVVDQLMGEIEKSIKFFQSRYPNIKIERIIVTGGASTLPEFPLYLANKFGISVEIGNAWRNVSSPSSQHNELLAVSYNFGVAAGLAERQE